MFNKTNKDMKKFDFRRQLKEMNLDGLKELKSYHLDLMLKFMGLNDKEYNKQFRYLSYIEQTIEKQSGL